jgi:LysM repeat protein
MNTMKNFKIHNNSFVLPGSVSFMVKWFRVFIIVVITVSTSFAQQNNLVIGGSAPKLFVTHKVTSKENFYSIGRMYNAPPKDIAAYNNLQFENGLNVGESIKIPLTSNNFTQSGAAATGEVLIPVYHTVQPKEGLYRVSLNYNKVPIASLKKWNHIQSDAVSTGSAIIVGFLKVTKAESPLAIKGIKTDVNVAAGEQPPAKAEIPKPDINPERLPPVKNPDKEKQEKKQVQETDNPKTSVTSVNTKSNINFGGGYFKKLFDDQAGNKTPVNENGTAGVFKSTSGWQDGKYYCFNNSALPGTVIKVTDNMTGKSVYAKVLDAIPDIKQNSDLNIILSNAAAEELGAAEGKFQCALSYVK